MGEEHAGGLEESGRQAVGDAQREGKGPGEERHERSFQASATPRRNPRRERREQCREAWKRADEDLVINDLSIFVAAHEIQGFEFHPANARASAVAMSSSTAKMSLCRAATSSLPSNRIRSVIGE